MNTLPPVARICSLLALFAAAGVACGQSTVPPPPSNVVAILAKPGKVEVNWSDVSNRESAYIVKRQPGFPDGEVSLPADTTSFEDVPEAGTYTYTIYAENDAGRSDGAESKPLTIVLTVKGAKQPRDAKGASAESGTVPGSPSNLRVRATVENIRLQWQDRSSDETGFEVMREVENAGTWQTLESLMEGADAQYTKDAPAQAGLYRYRVRAFNAFGASAPTGWVIANFTPAPSGGASLTVPVTPGSLAGSDIGAGRVMLTWADRSNNEAGFRIERRPAFRNGPVVVGPNATAYLDHSGNGSYSYRVLAFNDAGASPFTDWASVTVMSGATIGTGGVKNSGNSGNTGGGSGGGSGGGGAGGGSGGGTVGGSGGGSNGGGGGGSGGSGGGGGGGSGGGSGGGGAGGGAGGGSGSGGGSGGGSTGGTTPGIAVSGGSGGTCAVPIGNGSTSEGWTILSPAPDSRVIYISTSTGNDANSGMSEASPKRTIAAGYQTLRAGYPDWLLFKAGDTWVEAFPNWEKHGRSPSEPMVIRSYGTGERPVIKTGTGNAFSSNSRNVAITDLKFVAHLYNGSNGMPLAINMIGGPENYLIENCMIEGYLTGMVIQSFDGRRPRNIKLRRNVIVDSYRVGFDVHSAGCYLDGIDGLLMEENLFDRNGARDDIPNSLPNIFRRNIYIQANCTEVVTRGNISSRSAAEGMQQRAGGLCVNNLFLKNTTGLIFGKSGEVRNNVVLDSKNLDTNNPRGGGMEVDYGDGVIVEGNIFTQRSTAASYNLGALSVVHGSSNITLRRNIVYNWWISGAPEAVCLGLGDDVQNVVVENNDFQMPHGEYLVRMLGAATFRSNRYLSSNPTPFWPSGGPRSFSQWRSQMGDEGSVEMSVQYPDPNRNIATYMTSLSMAPATLEGFLSEARKQSRGHWRPEFTAAHVNDYIRTGYAFIVGNE